MAERRQSVRQKSLLRGRIFYNNRRNSVDCTIRDISKRGARLIFSDAIAIPDVVDLYIPQKEQTLRAEVHWRSGQEVGVSFAQAAAPASEQAIEPGDLAARVERLEAELAALKRVVKRLRPDPNIDDAA
jgi:hypothetical protein